MLLAMIIEESLSSFCLGSRMAFNAQSLAVVRHRHTNTGGQLLLMGQALTAADMRVSVKLHM